MYSLTIFAGGQPLCSQILSGQGRPPSTILCIRKLQTLGYPKVKTASLCFPHMVQYWSVMDGQTDGRMYLS